MGASFLITGTNIGVGKTMVGCALAFAFKVRGMRVGVMKPIELGCGDTNGKLAPRDGPALVASASSELPLDLVSPYRYRAILEPVAAALAEGVEPPSFDAIGKAYRAIAARSDVVILEDSGGLASPIDWRRDYADLAVELGLEAILVVANRGAFINAATLAIYHAKYRGVPVKGFILNALDAQASVTVERDADFVARASAASWLGQVRFKEPLGLSIVERLL